jgi:2-polyprenyl-3-methyl-5-hydroxy-6-metoxy-1,4-benzoquinol methylase
MPKNIEIEYDSKLDSYFGHERTEIKELLPNSCERVLEVGCGDGTTLKWLKNSNRCHETYGIEIFQSAALKAKNVVDHLFHGNIENDEIGFLSKKFDVILLLDVLEHLLDPWVVLKKLVEDNLNLNGSIIVSLPNIRHYSALFPLFFKGEWTYQKSGILDKTHFRFFTKKSCIELFSQSGLKVERTILVPVDITLKQKFFNIITLGLFRNLLAQRYIFLLSK